MVSNFNRPRPIALDRRVVIPSIMYIFPPDSDMFFTKSSNHVALVNSMCWHVGGSADTDGFQLTAEYTPYFRRLQWYPKLLISYPIPTRVALVNSMCWYSYRTGPSYGAFDILQMYMTVQTMLHFFTKKYYNFSLFLGTL